MATTNHLTLPVFLALTLLVHANINLDTPEHDALTTILQTLGVPSDILPENLCNMTGISCYRKVLNTSYTLKVTKIAFAKRGLKGAISPMIGKLPELRELSLGSNFLGGRIPPQIAGCKKLEVLNLRGNKFSGEIPREIASLIRLRTLDLSFNNFSGDLGMLKYFARLEKLSLENNMFTGKVPVSLRSFRNFRYLVPELNMLESVDTKRLPKRYIFAETIIGSSSTVQAPAPALMEVPIRKHKKSNRKKIIRWVLGFLAGCIVVSTMIFLVLFNKFKNRGNYLTIFSQSIDAQELAFLDDDDAVAGLTLIGRGGCGEVYRTDIPNEKIKSIAIKMVVQPSKGAAELVAEETKNLSRKMRQIRSEIQTMGQIRHRNLVSLLAHMSCPNCHYLVYEYMKNGSLQDIIQQVQAGERQLEWPARHKIAIGIVSGLEYLHMSHTTRIVHRDLTFANVLLDDDMEARITDFGFAISIPDDNTYVTCSNIAGGGYVAPEYHQTMRYTDKCDIYSFGVLLSVLVMGKFPSDDFFQQTVKINLVKWMRNVLTSDNPSQEIDLSLLGNGYEEQMFLVAKIACFCTLDNPNERPNSKDCRAMLAQIEH